MAEPFRLVFQALTQDLLTNVLTTRLEYVRAENRHDAAASVATFNTYTLLPSNANGNST
jgi:hypothetical protein